MKNATQTPPYEEYADGQGRRALAEYLSLGYIPLEQEVKEAFHRREQVSRTLEYAYDDFAIAALARALGREDVAAAFAKRAGNWRNVFDPSIGFVRGRHADGRWVETFDPGGGAALDHRGHALALHVLRPPRRGRVDRGASEGARPSSRASTGSSRRAATGTGTSRRTTSPTSTTTPARRGATQEEVRRVLASEYGLGPAGLKGNDDTGQMSAWYVFSAIGLYPVAPGSPALRDRQPPLRGGAVDVGGGRTFTVRAPGASAANLYVQSATLDGRPHERPWIAHADVVRGATLELRMGPRPNRSGGRGRRMPASLSSPVRASAVRAAGTP